MKSTYILLSLFISLTSCVCKTKNQTKGVRELLYKVLCENEHESSIREIRGEHQPKRSQRKCVKNHVSQESHRARFLEINDGLNNRLPIRYARGP